MKTKKPLIVRIVIWICVILMVVSLIGIYVVYMFSPDQEVGENIQGTDTNVGAVEEVNNDEEIHENLDLPEIDSENLENDSDSVLVTEDGEVEEMDETIEVQLENGETELVRLGDLSDAIQID